MKIEGHDLDPVEEISPPRRRRRASGILSRPLIIGIVAVLLVLTVLALILLSLTVFPVNLIPEPPDIRNITDPVVRVNALTNLDGVRNGVRTTLVQAIGGGLFFVTAFIAWLQVRTTRSGQVNDRFTKTIEQLGSEKVEVRLAAIYSLRQIASNRAYLQLVADILADYLRRPESTPGLDMRAALQILVVEGMWRKATSRPLNLSSMKLPDARLAGSDLSYCDLKNVDLTGSDLRKADLTRANLRDAILAGAYLNGAKLVWTSLENANLSDAHLVDADLERIRARGVNLSGAELVNADLTNADLTNANLTDANMNGVSARDNLDLTGASLTEIQRAHIAVGELIFGNSQFGDPVPDITPSNPRRGESFLSLIFGRRIVPSDGVTAVTVTVLASGATVDLGRLTADVIEVQLTMWIGRIQLIVAANSTVIKGRTTGRYLKFEGETSADAPDEVPPHRRVTVHLAGYFGTVSITQSGLW